MGIISWILPGLIVGILAKWIMPGHDPGGMIVTVIIGIAGSFVGGSLSSYLGFGSFTGFNPKSIIIAVAGAVLLLAVYRMLKNKK